MSIFDKILRVFDSKIDKTYTITTEINSLIEFKKSVLSLQNADNYIAKSDYIDLRERFASTYTFFDNLQKGNALGFYCKEHDVTKQDIKSFLVDYRDLFIYGESLSIAQHNENYLSRHIKDDKEYLDNILRKVDANILLDDEQRRVVLSDEDYTLVCGKDGPFY